MFRILSIAVLLSGCIVSHAQTTVYLRSGGPAASLIKGATNATPVVVTTATNHGFSAGDTIELWGVCSGGGASPISGYRKVMASPAPTATTFAISDLSGTPIAANGAWCDGSNPTYGWPGSSQWAARVTPYTLGAQPLGWLDGATGNLTRKLALGPLNGMASTNGLVLSGCPGACVITVSTSGYDPAAATLPVANGTSFSVWGTGTGLDTCGVGAVKGGPFTVASVSTTGWTSSAFTCPVSNGDYTHVNDHCGPAATPNDTIGGTEPCVIVSQIAYVGNLAYNNMITQGNKIYIDDPSDSYKFAWDAPGVGKQYPGWGWADYQQNAALRFFVDRTNTTLFRDLNYYYTHLMRLGGVSWMMNETISSGGDYTLGQGANYQMLAGVGMLHAVYGRYASAANKTAFLGRLYNDIDDPSNVCTKTGVEVTSTPGINNVVNSGIAQNTSSTSITLASGASASDNFYNGMVVVAGANAPSAGSYAVITGYTGSTKVATLASWTGGTPAANTPYGVYGSAMWSTVAQNAVATVTGIGTTFTTSTHVGDAIVGMDIYYFAVGPTLLECYVTAIADDTHLTCVNGSNVNYTASTTVPSVVWYFPAMTSSNCGLIWALKHTSLTTSPGSQPIVYPPSGTSFGPPPAPGANQVPTSTMTRMSIDLAAAPDDSRAVRDLGLMQGFESDFGISHYLQYGDGWIHSGSKYSPLTMFYNVWYVWELSQSIPTYPSLNPTGKWLSDTANYGMYTAFPDVEDYGDGNGHLVTGAIWGAEGLPSYLSPNSQQAGAYSSFAPIFFSPASTLTGYYKNWLQNIQGFNLLGYQGMADVFMPQSFLFIDPRIASTAYTAQPHQYLFGASDLTTCANVTAGACAVNSAGTAMISRTGLGPYSTNATDTLVKAEGRAYFDDHDNPTHGLSLYKVGQLIDVDSLLGSPPSAVDLSNLGPAVQFGGLKANWYNEFSLGPYVVPAQPATTQLLRWGSANHGSWDPSYGDQASKYSYFCTDAAGLYQAALGVTYDQECVADLKKSGNDQFVFDLVTAASSVSQSIAKHIHYSQNGQGPGGMSGPSAYPEGNTTCPGTGGCASLNTNRLIQSVEDNGTDGRNPQRKYGVMSTFLFHGNGAVNWDCPGNVECTTSPLSTYTGGAGYTDRVSVCGGASCGASVTKLESVIVHKVMQNTTDATLITTALNPDANWTGAQVCGAVSCAVFLGALGGTTHASMAGFTTTHSGSAQYLFGGLAPGAYTVTIDGTPVSGSPFTVSANDNSIEFENTAGIVSVAGIGGPPALALNPGSLSYSCVSGASNPAAQTIGVSAANVTLDNWSAAKTQSWLTLSPASGSAAGSIAASVDCAGQPVGTRTDTITVSSTTTGITNNPQTVAVSLTVSAALGVGSAVSGKTTASGNVTVH